MNHSIDLKELERRAFRSTFEDGIWDIYLGLLPLVMSVMPWVVVLFMRGIFCAPLPAGTAITQSWREDISGHRRLQYTGTAYGEYWPYVIRQLRQEISKTGRGVDEEQILAV